MKKVILSALPLLVCASSSAFAGSLGASLQGEGTGAGAPAAAQAQAKTDTTEAMLTWNYELPVVVPGHAFTLTGASSKALEAGDLTVLADGSFKSSPLTVELHTYDEESKKTGALVDFKGETGHTAQEVTYKVDSTKLTSSDGTDLSSVSQNALVKMDGDEVSNTGVKGTKAVTNWDISGDGLPRLAPGTKITATTYVIADVSYTDSK